MPDRIEFACVAEAVAYLHRFGYETTAYLDDCRVMRRGDSCAIIEEIGLLDVRVRYS